MGFTREQLQTYYGAEVPDLLGAGVKLLFVGINPGLWTAATQTHFSHPGNRFYPALLEAGIITEPIDRGGGMTDADRAMFVGRGLGITNLVSRATAKASELTKAELRDGRLRLERSVAVHRPNVVAVAGLTAFRDGFGRPRAVAGRQDDDLEDSQLWVVPNPSGLNAHDTTSTLAAAYRQAAIAAGVVSA